AEAWAVGRPFGPLDGHEVGHLAHAFPPHEPRDEHRRVGEVELSLGAVVALGGDLEVTAAVVVEQRCKDARRIEARAAEPIDGAVPGVARGRLDAPHHSLASDRWTASPSLRGRGGRTSVSARSHLPTPPPPLSQADIAGDGTRVAPAGAATEPA